MADDINGGEITGDWDDLVNRLDLRGRRVRVILLDRDDRENPWVNSLRAWAASHQALTHTVDDSRDAIYSGTADDPR